MIQYVFDDFGLNRINDYGDFAIWHKYDEVIRGVVLDSEYDFEAIFVDVDGRRYSLNAQEVRYYPLAEV